MEIYVETAIAAGVTEMCFTDHLFRYYISPVQRFQYNDWGIPKKHLKNYFKDVDALRRTYADRITIRTGLEIDFVEGAEHLVSRSYNAYPCDFLLGSVHCLPSLGWHHLGYYTKEEPELVYHHYFEAVQAALKSGLFQSLAHPDAIWRYIPYTPLMEDQLTSYISAAAVTAKKTGVALEINAGGYDWSLNNCDSFNPFEVLLTSIAQENTTITIGSDAHTPDDVARNFPALFQKLHSYGITECLVFDGKNKKSVVMG